MRGYHRPEEGTADFLKKFRRYSRGAGDTTVGWHKAYIYPGYLSTWVVSLGITSRESPRHSVQQLCLCTDLYQTAVLPSLAPTVIFSRAHPAQHLLLLQYYLFSLLQHDFRLWFAFILNITTCVTFIAVLTFKPKRR